MQLLLSAGRAPPSWSSGPPWRQENRAHKWGFPWASPGSAWVRSLSLPELCRKVPPLPQLRTGWLFPIPRNHTQPGPMQGQNMLPSGEQKGGVVETKEVGNGRGGHCVGTRGRGDGLEMEDKSLRGEENGQRGTDLREEMARRGGHGRGTGEAREDTLSRLG